MQCDKSKHHREFCSLKNTLPISHRRSCTARAVLERKLSNARWSRKRVPKLWGGAFPVKIHTSRATRPERLTRRRAAAQRYLYDSRSFTLPYESRVSRMFFSFHFLFVVSGNAKFGIRSQKKNVFAFWQARCCSAPNVPWKL